jgi:DNA (cytosine-5)-methyltransferase 1
VTRAPLVRLYRDEACADLFAGGGGASTGIEAILGRPPDVAINHDREALAMHRVNHPKTRHIRTDIREVDPRRALRGKKCGFAWFSPDCTFFSKAKGGQPFRDREKARRIRGLIGVALKWADQVRPRLMFFENVEEIEDWCPLKKDGTPDWSKRGQSFRRWVARLRNMGYVVEWRVLKASDFGAPTSRKRLFIIARCDGRPIVWPTPTPVRTMRLPKRRTAAECIDFSLPVPSIFLTPAQAKEWGRLHGCPSPKRPLAPATLRRVARGVMRYVIETADPFIIPINHAGDSRVHSVHDPLRTITCAERGEFAMVTPFLAKYHGEHAGRGDQRVLSLDEPVRTLDTSNRFALVAPLLVNTRNGERHGRHGEQAPRVMDIQLPFGTVTATGSQGAMVAAFLAKHNAGNEATGQRLRTPLDTVTTRDSKALVTSHLVKLYGTCQDGQSVNEPMPTITAHGNHIGEVRAFLLKYYGTKADGCEVSLPLDTITTKERFGLVTVTIAGEEWVIVDIGMRMLTPRELFKCQGFPDSYVIEHGLCVETGKRLEFTKKAQTRMVGNSVPPHFTAALLEANLGVPA